MARVSNLDFYAILGVHPNAEDIVIRAAFKALAQRYHPDRFNGAQDEAHRRMADLTNAYETLADPARRRKYDRRRGLDARKATFYFKNPARERQPPAAFALRAAARKAQYYRNAVYVLMVVVIVLSAFNVHQHAAQIRDLFAWNRPTSGAVAVANPGAGASAPVTSPTNEDAAQTTTTNVRILPIGQAITHPIGPSIVEPQAPAVRPATIEPRKAPAAAANAASGADAAPKDAKRSAPPKPVTAKSADAERPAAKPSAAEVDRCGPELVALGLCNRNSTAKGQ